MHEKSLCYISYLIFVYVYYPFRHNKVCGSYQESRLDYYHSVPEVIPQIRKGDDTDGNKRYPEREGV